MQTEDFEKTPADRRRLRVRESIISAAERVFAKQGESGLSIRRLAEEIDYSPAAIYKYFGSKEELVDELKEAFFQRLLQRIDTTSNSDRPFEQRARACVMAYIETAVTRPHHYTAAFTSIAQNRGCDEDAPVWGDFLETHKGQAFKILVDMVEEGQSLGVFDTGLDPVMAAKSLWAASHGLALLLISIPNFETLFPSRQPVSSKDFIAFHADILFRGLQQPAHASNGNSTDRKMP